MKSQIGNTKAVSYQTRTQNQPAGLVAARAISQGRKVFFTSAWTILLLLLFVANSELTPALFAQQQATAPWLTVQYRSGAAAFLTTNIQTILPLTLAGFLGLVVLRSLKSREVL